jgi:mono/diheme cytochrome c family protein
MMHFAATMILAVMSSGLMVIMVMLQVVGASSMDLAEEASFEAGQAIFTSQCAVCHEATGRGSPPAVPALAGNENLADAMMILTTVHRGRDGMPAFPQFEIEELTAVATYIRNAWENDFGPVPSEIEAAFQEAVVEPVVLGSVWDGVFTEAQASRGQALNERHCVECHGSRLAGGQFGGPPLAGRFFMHRWGDQSLHALFEYARTNMPPDRPGRLTDGQYLDLIAFILEMNAFPPGESALSMERLSDIIIEREPGD